MRLPSQSFHIKATKLEIEKRNHTTQKKIERYPIIINLHQYDILSFKIAKNNTEAHHVKIVKT